MAKKRRASPAQIAARKAFAAKYGGKKHKRKAAASRPKRPARRKSRRRSVLGKGRHRPVIIRRKGRYYRPKRSRLPSKLKLANPFLGNLAIVGGNPMAKRRRKSSKKSHRRSHRRSRGFALSNPLPAVLSAPRQMVSKDFITEAASVAAGFMLPHVILPHVPMQFRDSPLKAYASKVVIVAGLAGGASLVSKRVSKAILLGGGVSLLLDVWADFVAPMVAGVGSSPKPTVSAFYGQPGDPGVSAYWGNPGDPGVGSSIGDAFGGDGEAWG